MLERAVSAAEKPVHLTQERLRLARLTGVAGCERGVDRLGDDLGRTAKCDAVQDTPIANEQLGTRRLVLGPRVDRGGVEPPRRLPRAQGVCAVAGFMQRQPRWSLERGRVRSRGPGELQSAGVVVREHLGMIVRPAELLDPLAGEPVLLGSAGTRNLAIGDISNEQVPEGVLALARHRGPPLATDELLPLEAVQGLLGG